MTSDKLPATGCGGGRGLVVSAGDASADAPAGPERPDRGAILAIARAFLGHGNVSRGLINPGAAIRGRATETAPSWWYARNNGFF